MNVLITGPSLDTKKNIMGISSVVSNIILNSQFTFYHLIIGEKDGLIANINFELIKLKVYFIII